MRHAVANDADWQYLTTQHKKHTLYAEEAYFREAWADVAEVAGEDRYRLVQRVGILMFKPEAIAAQKVAPALGYLRRRGFGPILHRVVRLNRLSMRELWRYQWNVSTLERLEVVDWLYTAAPSLWTVVRPLAGWDTGPERRIPVSARLGALKGSPEPEERAGWELRSVLGSPNRMLTYVHVAEEPADLVREMGILYGRPARRSILRALAAETCGDVTRELIETGRRLWGARPPLEFGRSEMVRRVARSVKRPVGSDAGVELQAVLDELEAGASPEWRRVQQALRSAGLRLGPWDSVSLASELILHDDPGEAQLDGSGRQGWFAGRGASAL